MRFKDKYVRLELGFFIVYYIVFPILTAVEIQIFEPQPYRLDIAEKLLYGIVGLIPSWIYYKSVIQRFLFTNEYVRFIAYTLIYLFLSNLYDTGIHWIISELPFLPEEMINTAKHAYSRDIQYNLGHFISVYMLREIIVLSALGFFIRSARQEQEIRDLKIEQVESELNYLKVQLQPHFFFNTLNNIYALTLQRSEQAAPLVAKHAEMMRYILYKSSERIVSLKSELEFLSNYVDVEKFRHPDNISISFHMQGIDDRTFIEPLLLLPFIENAVKHGVQEETSEGFIIIIISLVDNELSIEVRNSKPAALSSAPAGIGLENVRRRLSILYPHKHSLEVTDTDSCYELRLTLTLKTDD